jgi:hypothetical protein
LESRYGMWDFCNKNIYVTHGAWDECFQLLTFPSAKAEMTLPSADRDLLMFLASSSTVPSAPVLLTWTQTQQD